MQTKDFCGDVNRRRYVLNQNNRSIMSFKKRLNFNPLCNLSLKYNNLQLFLLHQNTPTLPYPPLPSPNPHPQKNIIFKFVHVHPLHQLPGHMTSRERMFRPKYISTSKFQAFPFFYPNSSKLKKLNRSSRKTLGFNSFLIQDYVVQQIE